MSRSQLVVVGRCKDQPGIAMAFMKSLESYDCQVLDLTQFVLEGSLVFTFVLEVGEGSSFRLMNDLQENSKQFEMTLDFHFPPTTTQAPVDEKRLVLSLCSRTSIRASTLCAIDEVLSAHQCVVLEIEHRSDNKIASNGEFNKIQMLIKCPPGVSLASLYMGAPTKEGGSEGGLQGLVGESVQLTLRVWDAMNRPNGKSLVVFGLSDVLCPYDVLDELVKEAGADPKTVSSELEPIAQAKEKVALLKGKPASAVKSLISRLEFTKGAKMLCASLKAMGCRLAIVTNTGARAVAEHVKQQLGIDYVMSQNLSVENGYFTGEYEGISDVRYRKTDLLKLMADKEGIEYRNVIVVGEPLKGLKPSSIRSLLDTFGAHLYFNAAKVKHLSVVLYLLGFSGSHVQVLEERHGDDDKIVSAKSFRSEGCASYVMEVLAKTQKPAQLMEILGPLKSLDSSVSVDTVRQCSLQNGGMCCGLKLTVKDENADMVLKDIVFACQKQDMAVRITEHKNPDNDISTRYFQNRHIITMVQHPEINSSTLKGLFGGLAEEGVNIVRIDRLSLRRLTALQFTVVLPQKLVPEVEFAKFSEKLASLANKNGCDIALQSDDVERLMRRMIVFDMDSTLIQQEVIDELAKIAGVETQVKEITESAMRGEIDFFGSLKRRVALLKGHQASTLFSEVKKVIQFNPGAERLCSVLKKLGYKMAVISGGFLPVAEEVQRHLGLDYAFANTLEVDEQTGNLTGQTSGPVVTPTRKRALLATISDVEGCAIKQTIAVGDGANDIPMLHTAGLGIAFCAKPKVQAVSKYRINQKDLSTVLFLIGLSEHAIDRLAEISEDDSNGAPLMPDAKRQRVQ
mmetsp:Transcript_64463/g.100512  ORF Transcript_64463/g.100512 Transcript_64463/m.100512 type:complete len:851 (-) Transcript_64463:371-2923(-)